MPNYIYKCEDCKKEFKEFQLINEKEIEDCPMCGSKTAHRIPCFQGNITVKNPIGGVPVQTQYKDMSIHTEIVGKDYII